MLTLVWRSAASSQRLSSTRFSLKQDSNNSACFDGTFNTTFSYRPTSDSYNLTIAGFPSPYTNGSTTCNCMYGSTGPQNLTTSGSGAFITYSNSTVRVDYAASQSPLGSMAYGTIIPSYGGNGGCSYIFNPLAPFNGTLACIFNTRDDLECTGNVSYISYSRYGNPGSCWKGGDGASCYPRNYYTFVPYYPPSTETVYTGSPTGTATANSTATTSSQIGNTPTLSSTRTGTSSSAKPTTTSGGFIMLAPAKLFITLLVVAGVAVFLV